METTKTYHKQSLLFVVCVIFFLIAALFGRLIYLMVFQSEHYGEMAQDIHERERSIKAERGRIYDRNGVEIAGNKPVSTISVIHSQIKEPERVIEILSKELGLSEDTVRKRVEKVSSIERIKSNVDKETSDRIREYELAGVMVDEDYKRFYPYGTLASKVIGFTGSDNQGIIGLEVAYDKALQGKDGTILTLTTAKGIEIEDAAENRIEPVAGNDLYLSLDVNIQKYAEQAAKKVMEAKAAKSGVWWNLKSTQEKIDPEFPWRRVVPSTGLGRTTGSDQQAHWRKGLCLLYPPPRGSRALEGSWRASPGSRSPGCW